MEVNDHRTKRALFLITFAVLLYLGVQNIHIVMKYVGAAIGLIIPFIVGGAIAFILNVPMKFIERVFFEKPKKYGSRLAQKLARPISMLLSIFFVIAIIMIVVLVVAPELAATFMTVVKTIDKNLPILQAWLEEIFQDNSAIVEWINSIDIQPQKILDSAINLIRNGVDNVLTSTVSATLGIVNTAMNAVIGFIFAIYILLQKETLLRQMKKALYALLPEDMVEYIIHVGKLANQTFANFITGQCIEAVILGTMFFVVMSVLRFPYALLVGVLIAFTALIPMFGGFIGCAIGFILILMVSPMKAFIFLGIFLVLQQLEGNLIYPHVVGNSVGLPSIWVLVAVSVGGSLMGVIGMLVFIPLTSVLYALFREWANIRLKKKRIPKNKLL